MGPTVTGIELVSLYVDNLPRMQRFYEEALGLRFTVLGDWAEARLPDGARFALHASHPGGGEVHVPNSALADLRVADIAAAIARVRAAGAMVSEPVEVPTGMFATFTDPQGYRVQLFQPKR